MRTTEHPDRIPPATVAAYVDGELPATERDAFAARLLEDPAHAAAVAAARADRDRLRRYDRILEEPVPSRLVAVIRRRQRGAGGWWLALAATFVLGIAVGWLASGQIDGTPDPRRALPQEAALTHALYVRERRHAVEVPAEDSEHLNRWLSNRLSHPVAAPDLRALGFDFVGGRLLSDGGQPAAQFMYEDAEKERLTLFVRVHGLAAPDAGEPHLVHQGDLGVVFWSEGPLAYAWTGAFGEEALNAVAAATRAGR
jgi:anti-sigma factor RsiW